MLAALDVPVSAGAPGHEVPLNAEPFAGVVMAAVTPATPNAGNAVTNAEEKATATLANIFPNVDFRIHAPCSAQSAVRTPDRATGHRRSRRKLLLRKRQITGSNL